VTIGEAADRAMDREQKDAYQERHEVIEKDRLWVNESRTVMVRLWGSGTVEVATRKDPSHTWGPPVYLEEEK
jgi:hypothetical protein